MVGSRGGRGKTCKGIVWTRGAHRSKGYFEILMFAMIMVFGYLLKPDSWSIAAAICLLKNYSTFENFVRQKEKYAWSSLSCHSSSSFHYNKARRNRLKNVIFSRYDMT